MHKRKPVDGLQSPITKFFKASSESLTSPVRRVSVENSGNTSFPAKIVKQTSSGSLQSDNQNGECDRFTSKSRTSLFMSRESPNKSASQEQKSVESATEVRSRHNSSSQVGRNETMSSSPMDSRSGKGNVRSSRPEYKTSNLESGSSVTESSHKIIDSRTLAGTNREVTDNLSRKSSKDMQISRRPDTASGKVSASRSPASYKLSQSHEKDGSETTSFSSQHRHLSREKKGPVPTTYEQDSLQDTDEESEDDADLAFVPSFLKSIQSITDFPSPATPGTPEKATCGSRQKSTSSDVSMEYYSPLNPCPREIPPLKPKFTLDGLLAEKSKTEVQEQEMIEIRQELQRDLDKGGFVSLLDQEDFEPTELNLDQEHQSIINKLQVHESQIQEVRPGEKVFDAVRYQCLFGPSILPVHCGFQAKGSKMVEKSLETLTSEKVLRLVSSELIQMCFHNISCQNEVLRWLLFLMSVHESYLLRHNCSDILLDILHSQNGRKTTTWAPSVTDVLTILVNYGADLNNLVLESTADREQLRQSLFHQPGHVQPVVNPVVNDGQCYGKDNLKLVLLALACSLQGRPDYSREELTVLVLALCTASLDDNLKNLYGCEEFETCVCLALNQYADADWDVEKLKLIRLLSTITHHHHNQLHIAEILYGCQRGLYVQRRVSFLMLAAALKQTEDPDIPDEQLDKLPVTTLFMYIPRIKDQMTSDPYWLSSVVSLLGLCVGNMDKLTTIERGDLQSLRYQVQHIIRDIRDNVSMLDRTRVKDMLVRLTTQWSLEMLSMKTKQTKIFDYVKQDSPHKVKIEMVQTVQSCDVSDGSSQSESEDEAISENLPPKQRRIEETKRTESEMDHNFDDSIQESELDYMCTSKSPLTIDSDMDDDLPEL